MNRHSLINQVLVRIRRFLRPIAIAIARLLIPHSLRSLETLQHRLHDWAQLSVYQDPNAMVLPPAIDEHRVIFFGDSITEYWDLEVSFPGKPYINRGIAGQTTPQMLIRFRPDVIALHPQVVLILAGINDIAGNAGPMTLEMIEDNYISIAELAQANHIRVIFASILPVHDYGAIRQSNRHSPTSIQALNHWLRNYCTAHDHIYLDYYSSMLDVQGAMRAELSADGVHPNSLGYSVMTSLAEAAIQQILGKAPSF